LTGSALRASGAMARITPRQIAEDPIVVEAYLGGPSSKTA